MHENSPGTGFTATALVGCTSGTGAASTSPQAMSHVF
jgi:hypothetical protein